MNIFKEWLEFFHVISNLCKTMDIYSGTKFLAKTWKPLCRINDANFKKKKSDSMLKFLIVDKLSYYFSDMSQVFQTPQC